MWNLSAYLLTYSNFEVLIDSVIVVGIKTDTIISPRILSEGDRINKSSNWIEILDNELVLSTEYIIDSMCYQVGVVSFPGWLNNYDGYMGFRAFIDAVQYMVG